MARSLRFVAALPLLVAACGKVAATDIEPASAGGTFDAGVRVDLEAGSRLVDAGIPCQVRADCPNAGDTCAWPWPSDGESCGTLGTCRPPIDHSCFAGPSVEACGCDGETVTWVPCGWGAPVPLAHSGACAADASP